MGVVTGAGLGERLSLMDDETAAKFVLLDFEFVALIAMVSGVLVYALVRRLRRDPLAEGGRQ